MTTEEAAHLLIELYPKIFFACHRRHDPKGSATAKLTTQQEMVIGHLDENHPMSLSSLAKHMGVTASTMSLTVDRLERKGLVKRERSLEDRRSVRIFLTATGAVVKNAQDVLDAALVKRLLLQLEPEEREHGLYGLWLLGQGAQRLIERRGPGDPAIGLEETSK